MDNLSTTNKTAPAAPFLAGYRSLTVQRSGVMTCVSPRLAARIEVDTDLSPLFPYINGKVFGARYKAEPERLQFVLEDIFCTLYPFEIIAATFVDHDQAARFAESLLGFLNRIHEQRTAIKPDYRRDRAISPLDVYRILPKTNCGECGQPSCLAFAAALSQGTAELDRCPTAARPIAAKAVFPVLDRDGCLTDTVELEMPPRRAFPAQPRKNPADFLTGREIEVLKILAQGATNNQIAELLFVSPHTVKTHIVHICEKLGVQDRTQAAVLAARHHLV